MLPWGLEFFFQKDLFLLDEASSTSHTLNMATDINQKLVAAKAELQLLRALGDSVGARKAERRVHVLTAQLFREQGRLQRVTIVARRCGCCGIRREFVNVGGVISSVARLPREKKMSEVAEVTTTANIAVSHYKDSQVYKVNDPESDIAWMRDSKGRRLCPCCGKVVAKLPGNRELSDKQKEKLATQLQKAQERMAKLAAQLGVDPTTLLAGQPPAAE